MAKKASVILTEAAERIRCGRWIQGAFYDHTQLNKGVDNVPVCAFGAIDYCSEVNNWAHTYQRRTKQRYAAWAAARDYARDAAGGRGLADFNDTPGRTMTEVRNLLLRAADTAARNGE